MLFDEILPDDGERTIEEALTRLGERKRSLGLTEPWSLGELRPIEADYQWLLVWAKNLPLKIVQICLENQPMKGQMGRLHKLRTGLGVLLLLLFSEIARREATEGSVWPSIWKQLSHSGPGIRALFANHHADQECRELLRDAARSLELRHLFDETGVQAWLGTIYLQFGFTHRGFRTMLPDWLRAEQQTLAIRSLRAGRMRSRSFDAMWGALWQLRRGRTSPQKVREILLASEWVLDSWIPDLLNKAMERRRADEPNTDQAPGAESIPDPDFLGVPRLTVESDGSPRFMCKIERGYPFDPTSSRYEIVLGEETLGLLLRQADDSFALYDGETIIIPAHRPVATISLRDESGETAATQELTLWTPDVSLFSINGRRLDEDATLQRTGSYLLLCSPDLEMKSGEAMLPLYASSRLKLFRMTAGWSDSTCVTAQGHLLWQPRTPQRATPSEPEWLQKAKIIVLSEKHWGTPLRLTIRHPEQVNVDFVRSAGAVAEHATDEPGRTRVSGLRPDPALHRPQLTLLIGLRHAGEYHTLRHSIDTSGYVGCAIYADGEIHALRPSESLNLPAGNRAFRFFPPQTDGGSGEGCMWTLLEGDFGVISPSDRPVRLSGLAGYGAPITLRYGPYNARTEENLPIAQSVEDQGIVRDVQVENTEAGTLLRVTLDRPITPASKHQIRAWCKTSGQEQTLSSEVIHSEGCVWSAPWSEEMPPTVTALFFGESRLGAWWNSDWPEPFKRVLVEDVGMAARLLRDLKLPVLNEACLKTMRWMALDHDPGAFLAAWLEERGREHQPSTNDRWGEVIRRVFSGWKPQPDIAVQTLTTLGAASPSGPQNVWFHGARKLALVDPMLMARLLRAGGYQADPQKKPGLKRLLLFIADCADVECVRSRYQELIEEVQRRIVDKGSMDTSFIERGLLAPAKSLTEGVTVSQIERDNVRMALQVPAFRRLLALYLTLKMF